MNNLFKSILTSIFLAVFNITLGAQDTLPAITESDYAKWQTLGSFSISDNGSWLSWNISLGEGDDTLYIKNASTEKIFKYPLSTGNIFSTDSKWAASRIGYSEKQIEKMNEQKKPVKNKTRLLNLESGVVRIFDNIESFNFTRDANHLIMSGYANDNKTKDIYLHNLKTGITKNIANISEFAVNKPGNRLAYIINSENKKGNGVELMNLENYNISFLSNDTSVYRSLVWEREGNVLMFLKAFTDTSYVEDNHMLFIVRNIYMKPEIKSFNPSTDTDFPAGLRIKETYRSSVSDDHRIMFFGVYEWTKKEKKDKKTGASEDKLPGVDIWHWKDDPIQPRQKNTYSTDKDFTYLYAWNPETNKVIRITNDTVRQATITGDGLHAVISDDTPYKPAFREPTYDYYIADVTTGNKKLLLSNFTSLYGSSPGGKYILYFKDKNWWVYDISKGSHINLTEGIDTDLWNTRDDSPLEVKPPFGNGGWLKDDKALFVYDEYDVWKINMDGSKPLRLTNGKENRIRFRIQRLESEYPYIDGTKPLYFSASGDTTKESGYYRMTVKNKLEKLIYENKSISNL